MTNIQNFDERIFSRLALAYLFCNMNFNIGPINILPEFAGYLFLLSAFRIIADVRPEIKRLNSFVYFLLVMSILSPVVNFLTSGAIQVNSFIPLSIISSGMMLNSMAAISRMASPFFMFLFIFPRLLPEIVSQKV